MQPLLNLALANIRHRELLQDATRRRRPLRAPASSVTVRLATRGDRAALARLAELEQTTTPAEPLLLGVVMERPVAALSLSDDRVIADPFTPTCDLIELMRVRARQLRTA
jgi:hypothetical protein